MMTDWPTTRHAGLDRLAAFAPHAGRAYASGRNSDYGASKQQAVSLLSPYLRRRMITEREVVEEVLKHHSAANAEKFIQEVFWRTYWKGWLEMRPTVWQHYLAERTIALTSPSTTYEEAIEGRTGIAEFDDWAHELTQTGYLHNHARMWFASIWIFTLKLPWALGADFFYQHLLDADPASNTLSWRWVAGLHTKGKTYLARADNIEKYTQGRFRPTGLAPYAEPLMEGFETPAPLPPRDGHARLPNAPYALLLTSDDLHPQSWPGFETNPPALVLTTGQTPQEADLNSGQVAASFTHMAMEDAKQQLGTQSQTIGATAQAIIQACRSAKLSTLAMPFAPVGPTNDWRTIIAPALMEAGINLHEVKRSWDDKAWPHATAGFFKLKKKIPKLMAQAGLEAGGTDLPKPA